MKKHSDWTLSQKILEGACLVLLAGMILLPLLLWNRLPDQIPGHYNGAGEIDRWAGKIELFVLPFAGLFLYAVISFPCAILWELSRKGEAPRSACTCLTAVKLVMLGSFAVIEWHSASVQPMVGWLTPVAAISGGALMAGFAIVFIQFAVKQSRK